MKVDGVVGDDTWRALGLNLESGDSYTQMAALQQYTNILASTPPNNPIGTIKKVRPAPGEVAHGYYPPMLNVPKKNNVNFLKYSHTLEPSGEILHGLVRSLPTNVNAPNVNMPYNNPSTKPMGNINPLILIGIEVVWDILTKPDIAYAPEVDSDYDVLEQGKISIKEQLDKEFNITEKPKEEDQEIVYRALNEKDVERLLSGQSIEAKNPKGLWSLRDHILYGSQEKISKKNDPYISTSESLKTAQYFNTNGDNYGIVKINLKEVTKPYYRGWLVYKNNKSDEHIISKRQQEVSVYQEIPITAIKGYIWK